MWCCCGAGEDDDNTNNSGGHTLGGGRDTYQTFPVDTQLGPRQPDNEEKRRQLADAAEKRRKSQEGRGVKDLESVRRQQKRQDEIDRLEREARLRGDDGSGGLKWQMS